MVFPIAIGYEIIAVTQKAYNGVAIVATSDENDCKGSRQLLVVLNAGKST